MEKYKGYRVVLNYATYRWEVHYKTKNKDNEWLWMPIEEDFEREDHAKRYINEEL